ncbi:MAG: hypothetical protein ACLFVD_03350 [Dehalococcoidia bacterium]
MDINVTCYCGYIYGQEPRSFVWEEEEQKVKLLEKAWQGPGTRLFRVVTQAGRLFELCYREADDRWSAVELTSSARPAALPSV